MSLRTGLLALCVVAAAGCARAPDAGRPAAGADAATSPAAPVAEAFAMHSPAARFARLPDRGELVSYPGHVKRVDGAYTAFRADVSEAHALHAMADGHLRLTTPEGQLLDVRYDRHVEHPTGDWTWIGHLPGDPSAQTIITFGDRAAFGSIAQGDGKPPLRLTVRDGLAWLVETDPTKVAAIVNAATRPTKPDYHVVPLSALRPQGMQAAPVVAAAAPAVAATATAGAANTVDLVIGYTQGFVSAQGSVSAVNTRLNYLVDVANAAYVNSQVSAQVRLVHTMQVNYTDLNTNDLALQGMSGRDANGNPGTVDPAFTALRSAREQYGADLVSLVRPFKDPEQSGCGLAWLIGGAKQGIQPGVGWDQLAYSVVGDGTDQGSDGKTYYCRDETLAHEMGHNEGSAHDRATAEGSDGVLNDPQDYGAYQYSFGYKTTSTTGNFYTIMAYGDTGQTSYRTFSNPRTTFCGARACGTTTYEDNARSLSQTIPVVATFRAMVVPLGASVRGDFDGDGRSDVLWRNYANGTDAIWRNASAASPMTVSAVGDLNWKMVGSGDFDGDGKADILWRNASTGANAIWLAGNSATSLRVTTASLSWDVAGVGDIDGDGRADIVWRNHDTGANVVWRSGDSTTPTAVATVANLAWKIVAVGDFDGDGHDDLLWRNASTGANAIWRSANSAAPLAVTTVPDAAWIVAGAADFNGDGRADIVWRNRNTGVNAIWRSGDSTTPQSVATVPDQAWSIVGVGDYDGDGLADLLWRNASTGKNVVWRTANSAAPIAMQDAAVSWRVAP